MTLAQTMVRVSRFYNLDPNFLASFSMEQIGVLDAYVTLLTAPPVCAAWAGSVAGGGMSRRRFSMWVGGLPMARNWAEIQGVPQVLEGLRARVEGMLAGAAKASMDIADLLQSYAKTHHPWQSETGDTQASIKGQIVEFTNTAIKIAVSAGMPYDVFLELAHEGKWAWLWRAVTENEAQIRAILEQNLSVKTIDRIGEGPSIQIPEP